MKPTIHTTEQDNKLSYIVLGGTILLFLTFFMPWAYVYNTDLPGIEVSFNGWAILFASVSGNFSSSAAVFGDIAVPFYYYAETYCKVLGVVTIITFVLIAAEICLRIASLKKRNFILSYLSAVFMLFTAFALIGCFVIALTMNGSKILPVYCSGNPACSVCSLCIIPAIISIAATILSFVHIAKNF